MSDYIGVRNFCSFCKHSKEEGSDLICKNENSRFYKLPTTGILCAPCISRKMLKEDTVVEYVGFGD